MMHIISSATRIANVLRRVEVARRPVSSIKMVEALKEIEEALVLAQGEDLRNDYSVVLWDIREIREEIEQKLD